MLFMDILTCKNQSERLELLSKIVPDFHERAAEHDVSASFPMKNFDELKKIKYPGLTVPEKYGGKGITLTEMLELQEVIARADGSTALSIGWHMGIVKSLGESNRWDEDIFAAVAREIVDHGALLNSTATEPATGSPTRGGRPETTAIKTADGWEISGHKTFTTMAPVLDYFLVTAGIEGSDEVGSFLVHRALEGVSIKNTWDALGMRATGSDDLILKNVKVDADKLVETIEAGNKEPAGWLLHIPVTYLGIAEAALNHSADFANQYSPNSIQGTIADLPNVKQKLGEAELKRVRSRHFLYSVARKWDEGSLEIRREMGTDLAAVKYAVVNDALEIVDLSMRVVGARSLAGKSPLGRYYRDVRAGLHNPPMDDMTVMKLAARALARVEQD